MNDWDGSKYGSDKGPSYLAHYDGQFAHLRNQPIKLLELGVFRGGSLLMWQDYFPHGQIFGVDLEVPEMRGSDRIHLYEGNATDPEVFARIEQQTSCSTFDVIIDDASHVGIHAKASFEHLFFERLVPGGLYVLEDWGTSYRPDWPDGVRYRAVSPSALGGVRYRFPSHEFGMIGFAKHLIDAVGRSDALAYGGTALAYPIESILIVPGLVFIKKSSET